MREMGKFSLLMIINAGICCCRQQPLVRIHEVWGDIDFFMETLELEILERHSCSPLICRLGTGYR